MLSVLDFLQRNVKLTRHSMQESLELVVVIRRLGDVEATAASGEDNRNLNCSAILSELD